MERAAAFLRSRRATSALCSAASTAMAAATGKAAATAAGTRGQEGCGLQLPGWSQAQVRLPSPPRASPVIESPLAGLWPAGPDILPACSVFGRRRGTSPSNKEKGMGLSEETVTRLNSADKDLFAVNLLNLWKFIGNS